MTIHSIRLRTATRDEAVGIAASRYHVRPAEILRPIGSRPTQHARQFAIWLIRQHKRPTGHPAYSYPEIGRAFGLDHSTAIHAVARVSERLAATPAGA